MTFRTTRRVRSMDLWRRPAFVLLLVFLFLGSAVYFRLWSLQSELDLTDPEVLRKQFEHAHNEAVDEAAEWRLKYDEEVEATTKHLQELVKVKETLDKKTEEAESINNSLDTYRKENLRLMEQVKSLTQQLEAQRLKCSKGAI